MLPKIAIVYLSFHCEPYLPMVLPAIEHITYPKDRLELVIVDNPHPQHGTSVPYLQREVVPKSGAALPRVTVIANESNLGFAGGNNVGLRYALAADFDYIFFLNNDAYPAPNCFEPLVRAMEENATIGIAQPLIMLHQDPMRINSAGNAIHFLGFGYCNDYKKIYRDNMYSPVMDIPYASGAAMLVRASLAKRIGGWDPDLYLYHEDLEWSLRTRMVAQMRVVLVSGSRAYHAYEFSRSITKYFWMERNRFAVWLMYLRAWTLFVFMPAMLLMELGQFCFAIQRGWWREKLRVYQYWLAPRHWRLWLAKRAAIQRQRVMSDRALGHFFTGRVLFQERQMEHWLITYVANPFFAAYWRIVKHIL